jgi:hypothetical protein
VGCGGGGCAVRKSRVLRLPTPALLPLSSLGSQARVGVRGLALSVTNRLLISRLSACCTMATRFGFAMHTTPSRALRCRQKDRSARGTSGANGANCPFWVLFVGIEVKNLRSQGRHTVTGTVNSGRSAVSQSTRYNLALVPASAVSKAPLPPEGSLSQGDSADRAGWGGDERVRGNRARRSLHFVVARPTSTTNAAAATREGVPVARRPPRYARMHPDACAPRA